MRSSKAPKALRALRSYHPSHRPHSFLRYSSTSSSSSSSSVNPSEISHFKSLASSWWDPHGSSRLLHLMNPLRHDFISDCLSSQPSRPYSSNHPTPHSSSRHLRYLDIGCGGGIFAESAARLPTTISVTAIDPTPTVISIAVEHARQDPLLHSSPRLQYINTSIEDLPVPTSPSKLYDIVALWEVIEHVQKPAEFLRRCMPFVKPGGWIVLSTIARTWTSWVTTKIVAEEVLGVVPRGTHSWEKYVNEGEVRGFFEKEGGWGVGRCRGVVYVPGLGWRVVQGGEKYGNYIFGVRRDGIREGE